MIPFDRDPNAAILKQAILEAQENWEIWKDDFDHLGSFQTLPVLNSYPRFLGFGFDYSVFRTYNRKKIRHLFDWLSKQEDPTNFAGFHSAMSALATQKGLSANKKNHIQKNHISCASKLLSLWKPDWFPMWDTYARKGLKACLSNRPKGHSYNITDSDNYEIYRSDFAILADAWETAILNQLSDPKEFVSEKVAVYRVLDNYLMQVGSK